MKVIEVRMLVNDGTEQDVIGRLKTDVNVYGVAPLKGAGAGSSALAEMRKAWVMGGDGSKSRMAALKKGRTKEQGS